MTTSTKKERQNLNDVTIERRDSFEDQGEEPGRERTSTNAPGNHCLIDCEAAQP